MHDTKSAKKAVQDRLTQLGFDSMPAAVVDALVLTAEAKAQKAREGAVTRQTVASAFTKYTQELGKQEKAAGSAPKGAPAPAK